MGSPESVKSCLRRLEDDAAEEYVKELQSEVKKFEEYTIDAGKLYLNIALAYLEAAMFKQSLPFGSKAKDCFENLISPPEGFDGFDQELAIAMSKRLLAVIHAGLREYESAYIYDYEAGGVLQKRSSMEYELVRTEIVDAKLTVSVQEAMGRMDSLLPDMDKSGKCLTLIEKSQLFLKEGNYENSQSCLSMAVYNIRSLHDSKDLGHLCIRLFDVFKEIDDLEEVDVDFWMFFPQIIELFGESWLGELGWKVNVLLGKYKLRIGMEREAIRLFLIAEDYLKSHFTRRNELGKVYLYLDEALAKQGDNFMAIHMLKLAEEEFSCCEPSDGKIVDIGEKLARSKEDAGMSFSKVRDREVKDRQQQAVVEGPKSREENLQQLTNRVQLLESQEEEMQTRLTEMLDAVAKHKEERTRLRKELNDLQDKHP